MGLTLVEYSDRELLWHLKEQANEEGWATTYDLASAMSIDSDRATQCVGSRLAWLKRFGVVDGGNTRWRLLPTGLAALNGTLTAGEAQFLDSYSTEQLVAITRWLTARYKRTSAPMGHLVRREWVHGTYRPPAKKKS